MVIAEKPFGCKRHPILHRNFSVKLRTDNRTRRVICWFVIALTMSGGAALCARQNSQQQSAPPPQQTTPPPQQKAPPDSDQEKSDKDLPAQAFMPRGKKLC